MAAALYAQPKHLLDTPLRCIHLYLLELHKGGKVSTLHSCQEPVCIPINLPLHTFVLMQTTVWMSDAVTVDLARSMRIIEVMDDFKKYLSWIASVQTSPLARYYNDTCDLALQRCKAEAHQLLSEPFEALAVPVRTQDQSKSQLRWYVPTTITPSLIASSTSMHMLIYTPGF